MALLKGLIVQREEYLLQDVGDTFSEQCVKSTRIHDDNDLVAIQLQLTNGKGNTDGLRKIIIFPRVKPHLPTVRHLRRWWPGIR